MDDSGGLRLKTLVGSVVRLTFSDGHVVVGELISVDVGSTGREIIYDVLAVDSWGHVPSFELEPRRAAAAALKDLITFELAQV